MRKQKSVLKTVEFKAILKRNEEFLKSKGFIVKSLTKDEIRNGKFNFVGMIIIIEYIRLII